jgi:hypothetical protein
LGAPQCERRCACAHGSACCQRHACHTDTGVFGIAASLDSPAPAVAWQPDAVNHTRHAAGGRPASTATTRAWTCCWRQGAGGPLGMPPTQPALKGAPLKRQTQGGGLVCTDLEHNLLPAPANPPAPPPPAPPLPRASTPSAWARRAWTRPPCSAPASFQGSWACSAACCARAPTQTAATTTAARRCTLPQVLVAWDWASTLERGGRRRGSCARARDSGRGGEGHNGALACSRGQTWGQAKTHCPQAGS